MKARAQRIARVLRQEFKKEMLYLYSARRPKKVLFDHLPKCGGSSLNEYLFSNYPKRKTYVLQGWHYEDRNRIVEQFKNRPLSRRHAYDLVLGHNAHQLIDYVHPECLRVTVLREPVERIVSHYCYVKRTPEHYLFPRVHQVGMQLEEYLALSGELRNAYTRHFSGLDAGFIEQNPVESINKAFEVLMTSYDIVGFLDNYSAFCGALREKAQLRHSYGGERVNVTKGRISIDEMRQSTIWRIKDANRLDIELHNKLQRAIG